MISSRRSRATPLLAVLLAPLWAPGALAGADSGTARVIVSSRRARRW